MMAASATALGAAQAQDVVQVTAARANIRASASESSKVIAQVSQGMDLDLVAVEGDWYHVRLPVSGVRVEAYISKKVAKLGPPPAPLSTTAPPSPPSRPNTVAVPVAAVSSSADRGAISVLLTSGGSSTPIGRRRLQVVAVADKVDALSKAAALVPATGSAAGRDGDKTPVTFVWTADGRATGPEVTDRRPVFIATYDQITGLNPDDLAPVLVRLTPAASGVDLVAALRGRADEASRTDIDWDVFHDLKQDVIRTQAERLDRGRVRITPVADLAPGPYAVVLRLAANRKVAGSALLGQDGEGRVFSVAWTFSVR